MRNKGMQWKWTGKWKINPDCDTQQSSYRRFEDEEQQKDLQHLSFLNIRKSSLPNSAANSTCLINNSFDVNGFFASIFDRRCAFSRYLNFCIFNATSDLLTSCYRELHGSLQTTSDHHVMQTCRRLFPVHWIQPFPHFEADRRKLEWIDLKWVYFRPLEQ